MRYMVMCFIGLLLFFTFIVQSLHSVTW